MYNEKQKEYTMRYLSKLKEIRFRVSQEDYERYKAAAERSGKSMRQFLIYCIEAEIKRQ